MTPNGLNDGKIERSLSSAFLSVDVSQESSGNDLSVPAGEVGWRPGISDPCGEETVGETEPCEAEEPALWPWLAFGRADTVKKSELGAAERSEGKLDVREMVSVLEMLSESDLERVLVWVLVSARDRVRR